MMQPGTMIFSKVGYYTTVGGNMFTPISRGEVGVVVKAWRCGHHKKYQIKFLRFPETALWVKPGTIRRLK